MKRLLLIPLLLLPLAAGAATYPYTSTSTTASSSIATPTPVLPSTNTYLADSRVIITNALSGDLITAGGTVQVLSRVAGDILAAAGTLSITNGAGGDVRVAGGKVLVQGPITGEVAAAGGTVRIQGDARSIYAAGGSVDVVGSSTGEVTIYGANIFLSGTYQGNVSVIASNRLTLGEGTYIRGQLRYSAPEELVIPDNTRIDGGTQYTGAYAYVPTTEKAHQYALIGGVLFFAVRVLAGVIVAGLIVGLFPVLVSRICAIALTDDTRRILKNMGIGLVVAIGTPLLSLFLLVSFVGAELALLLIVAYVLLALVAYAFTGVLAGALLRQTVFYRLQGGVREFVWQDAVVGTVLIHMVGLIPILGTPIVFLFAVCAAGAICIYLYRSALAAH
jgi:hypothetical protein